MQGQSWLPANSSTYLEQSGPAGVPALLSVTNLNNGNIKVFWTTQASVNYQLQTNLSLATNTWGNFGGALAGTVTNLSVTDSIIGQTNRFYRVSLAP